MTERVNWPLCSAISVLVIVPFITDLLAPPSVTVWKLYVVAVLVSLWVPRRAHVFVVAAVCTVLTLVGTTFPLTGISIAHDFPARFFGILLIWATAILGLGAKGTAGRMLSRGVQERINEQARLLDQVPDAVLVRDLDDRICYWNHGAERVYGWSAAEALGRNANELLYQNSTQQLLAAEKEVLEHGQWTGRTHQFTKHGARIVCDTHWVLVLDEHGQPRAKLVVNTDITEKINLETQLWRSQRLESVGTLASGIAHDINNLLTPILMATKLLQKHPSDAKRERLLTAIRTSAERGADLVKQLLAFAGGGVEVDRKLLQPEKVIAEVHALLAHTLPSNIQLQVSVADNLQQVRGDVTQLSQVLMNICINARDAMPSGGVLSLTAKNVSLDDNHVRRFPEGVSGPHVLITIADEGMGMPPEVMDKVFDPFFTTKKQGGGAGLGLSTVLGIVKAHGGHIIVGSEVGRGTLFSVYLPAAAEANGSSATSPSPNVPRGAGQLILIVDDEEALRETAAAALEQHGYGVLLASDGNECLSIVYKSPQEVGAVLLDLMMPGMEATAIVAGLRHCNPDIRIIAMSGLHALAKSDEMLRAGIDAFLPKPFAEEQLLSALAAVLYPQVEDARAEDPVSRSSQGDNDAPASGRRRQPCHS